jgi:uncharacterized protein (TIGR03083 family)
MEHADYIAALRRDGEGFVRAAREADLATTVPSCPDWTVADLVWHVAEVHDFWCAVARERMSDPDGYQQPPRPGDDGLVDLAAANARALADVLEAADPATPVWTWADRKDIGFISRRMAQETAVHRVDAELAIGRPEPIEAELASDGIDEFLEHFTDSIVQGSTPVDGTVHLHCTDVAGEWLVRCAADGGLTFSREHAKGDAAVRGPASGLLNVLWRRQPLSTVEVIGDAGIAAAFVARTRLD